MNPSNLMETSVLSRDRSIHPRFFLDMIRICNQQISDIKSWTMRYDIYLRATLAKSERGIAYRALATSRSARDNEKRRASIFAALYLPITHALAVIHFLRTVTWGEKVAEGSRKVNEGLRSLMTIQETPRRFYERPFMRI